MIESDDSIHMRMCDLNDIELYDAEVLSEKGAAFESIWDALSWTHVRARIPECFGRSLRNRYMLANLIYLGYTIGILVIDFDPTLNGFETSSTYENSSTENLSFPKELYESINDSPYVNRLYIGFALVHAISAFLYLWSWVDRSWFDVVLIPEYINHIEAALYIWSAFLYPKQDTAFGFYTLSVHRIELAAAFLELVASFGWIMSWFLTYTRTLGRGFTFDDPDVIAFTSTLISSIIYVIYNIQINVNPECYATNYLYTYGDIIYFIGAFYFILATLRDDDWFWFMPLAGQYGIAPEQFISRSINPLMAGRPPVLITDMFRRRIPIKISLESTSTSVSILS